MFVKAQSISDRTDRAQVTPQIRQLIEQYHIGSILLVAKNLRCISDYVLDIGTMADLI
jgi:hypothetical protein